MNSPVITDFYSASHPASNRPAPYPYRVAAPADPHRSVRSALIDAGIIRPRVAAPVGEVTPTHCSGPMLRLDAVGKRAAKHQMVTYAGRGTLEHEVMRSNLVFADLPWLSNAGARGIE